ncbi:MAG: GNAT family N-acetyltransferase [Chloroflexi bacterium]|nr:GNAT family N-acetyltransferase [Chloroflexota bacterium]
MAQNAAIVTETFSFLKEEWEAVLQGCSQPSVFLTPRWQRVWWECFGRGAELHLLALRSGRELLGIAPLMCRDDVLAFLGDTDLFDYHDFLVPAGREDAFYPALAEALASLSWRTLRLLSVPQGSPTLSHLPALARARGWAVEVVPEDVSPGMALPASWEEYLEGLDKHQRHELRRKLRRLSSQYPLNYYAVSDPNYLTGYLDDFLALMRLSKDEKSRFLTPQREEFFRLVARELAQAGVLQLYFLELEGRRVAAALCFDYGDQRFLYNSGFDPEYSELSVGLLLKALSVKDAIAEGLRYYDFLRGNEPYKYRLGGKDRQVYTVTVGR